MDEDVLDFLQAIAGITEAKARNLGEAFPSLEDLRRASVEEIARIPGIGRKLARDIKSYLGKKDEIWRGREQDFCPICFSTLPRGAVSCEVCSSLIKVQEEARFEKVLDPEENESSLDICSNCGALVEKEENCRVCSRPLEKDPREENFSKIYLCPVCGAFLSEGERKCPSCGITLKKSEMKKFEGGEERFWKQQDPTIFFCDRCGAFLSKNARSCEVCGRQVRRGIPAEKTEEEQKPRARSRERRGLGVSKDFLKRWEKIRDIEKIPLDRELEEKLDYFNKLLEANPSLEKIWLKKAKVLEELGRVEEAIACYDQAAKINPEKEREYKIEVLNILRLKEGSPAIPPSWFALPSPQDREKLEEALSYYDKILEINPNLKVAWQTKGELLDELGRHEEAVECYDRAIEIEREEGIESFAKPDQKGLRGLAAQEKGRINGLGRTNGLVNGRGRVKGLVNGLKIGRVNGRINGLVNGLGRVNGLVNGLINGNGLTNGRRGRYGPPIRPTRWRWTRGAVGMASLILLMLLAPLLVNLIFIAPTKGAIVIDGDFSDWYGIMEYTDDPADQKANNDVNILSYKIHQEDDVLSFYAKVNGTLFGGKGLNGTDVLYAFLDADDNNETGYLVQNLGADYLVETYGWNNTVVGSTLYSFKRDGKRNDWNAFVNSGGANVAAGRAELEVQLWVESAQKAKMLLYSSDVFGNRDMADVIVSPAPGALKLIQSTIAPEILSAIDIPFLDIQLKAYGKAVTLNYLKFIKMGSLEDSSLNLSLHLDNGN